MTEMVEVFIDSIRVSLMSPQRVVVLRQRDVERYLPVWVGPYEADAITVALQEVETARPLTQDLLRSVINLFGARVVRVEVVSLKEDIFYGNIILEREGQVYTIDSRPSDAIALAVRAHAPILVDSQVMQEAAILPEKELQEEPTAPEEIPTVTPPEPPTDLDATDENRLDVFEDFLKKLGGEPDQDKPE